MPYGDGTGPRGMGAGTGYGFGPCGAGIRRGFGRRLGWKQFAYVPQQVVKTIANEKDLQMKLELLEHEEQILQQEKEHIKKIMDGMKKNE